MRVAIIGTRECGSITKEDIIPYIPTGCTEIISGGAEGVDTLAQQAAATLKINFTVIRPEYEKYHRAAPLIRNKEIVNSADRVLAFWDLKSRGTASVLDYCIKSYIPFRIVPIIDGKLSDDENIIERLIH